MNTPINEAVERANPVTKEDLIHAIFDKVARAEDLMLELPPPGAMKRFNEASATLKSIIDQLFEARAALPPPIVEPVKTFPLIGGSRVVREDRAIGPHGWLLYTDNGRLIRALNKFEAGFIDSALAVRAPMHASPEARERARKRAMAMPDGPEYTATPASAPSDGAADARALDPVVEANRELLHQRSQVGIKKYGVTLGDANLSEQELLQHALEEVLDLGNYIQALLMRKTPSADARKKSPRRNAWQALTSAGQVKAGDKLRFKIGDKSYKETAREILCAGTDKEEVVYDMRENFYFITGMVLRNSSQHKNVEFLASTHTTTGGENA